MKQELSILVPTYNGDCRAMVTELHHQAEAIAGLRYEMIIADDGSRDGRILGMITPWDLIGREGGPEKDVLD